MDKLGWYSANSGKKTRPVRTKAPSEWGLYDMHGNVWEWCQDRYGSYPTEDETDPVGPSKGAQRVMRGGSFSYLSEYCQATYRGYDSPKKRDRDIGFRCVINLDNSNSSSVVPDSDIVVKKEKISEKESGKDIFIY